MAVNVTNTVNNKKPIKVGFNKSQCDRCDDV